MSLLETTLKSEGYSVVKPLSIKAWFCSVARSVQFIDNWDVGDEVALSECKIFFEDFRGFRIFEGSALVDMRSYGRCC